MNAAIMDVVVEVLTEVLCILAIATKEINQNRASEYTFEARLACVIHLSTEMFLKKLVGRKDIEDAIQRLEKVTSEEARMAAAEALNSLHGVGDKVMGFDHRDGIQSTPKALEVAINVVTESLQGADVRAKDTRNKAINGASTISDWSCPSLNAYSIRCRGTRTTDINRLLRGGCGRFKGRVWCQ
jgi:hypothetical protein